jgi:hypothetical protein
LRPLQSAGGGHTILTYRALHSNYAVTSRPNEPIDFIEEGRRRRRREAIIPKNDRKSNVAQDRAVT